jgi:phosphopantetheinyl transferase (holo-ACP synthase)
MPLVYQQNINEHTKIGVWHILETDDFFLEKVTEHYKIRHFQKKTQHLAGRYLLLELAKDISIKNILLSTTGKPFLTDNSYFFSISHSADYVAVIISTKSNVAIDIQDVVPKIESIKQKFLTEEEMNLLSTLSISPNEQFTFAWTVKEAMFKYFDDSGVDFKQHLNIASAIVENDVWVSKSTFNKNDVYQLPTKSIRFNDLFMTWIQ